MALTRRRLLLLLFAINHLNERWEGNDESVAHTIPAPPFRIRNIINRYVALYYVENTHTHTHWLLQFYWSKLFLLLFFTLLIPERMFLLLSNSGGHSRYLDAAVVCVYRLGSNSNMAVVVVLVVVLIVATNQEERSRYSIHNLRESWIGWLIRPPDERGGETIT